MKIIIEKLYYPNGYLKVSAIDELTGLEDYVCQKPINASHILQMQNVAMNKLVRKIKNKGN